MSESAPEFSKLLNKEIKLLAEIKHHSIVSIYEAGKVELDNEIAGLNSVKLNIGEQAIYSKLRKHKNAQSFRLHLTLI